jgi:hypothetical protein
MDVIHQKLVVRDWPLKKPGDEMFFGYLVALGVFPGDWSDESEYLYADFAYDQSYSRYRLPNDKQLLDKLGPFLCDNFELSMSGHGLFCKLWIQLTQEGYKVDLP